MRESKEREKRKHRYADARARAEKQESGGGPSAFKVPKGLSLFKWEKPGTYKLRVLPYVVSDRDIDHRFADPDFEHFEYSYWVHASLGLDNRGKHCCLRETFHKPCPICEWLNTLDRWGTDKETYNTYRPKQRQLFALLDTESKDKGIQLYETSFFSGAGQMSLGQWIDNMIKANPDKYAGFFHLQDGMNLHINVKQGKPFNGSPTWNIAHVEAVEAKDLDDSIMDDIPALNDLPIELSYEELDEIFQQKQGAGNKTQVANKSKDDDEGESSWSKKPKAKTEDLDFEAGDEVVFDGDTYTVKRITHEGVVVLEDEDGIVTKVDDPSEISLAPKKKGGKKEEAPARSTSRKPVDEDEDDDEEELDEDDSDEEEDEEDDSDDEDEELDEDDSDDEEEETSEDDSELEPDEDDEEEEEAPAKKPSPIRGGEPKPGKKPTRR